VKSKPNEPVSILPDKTTLLMSITPFADNFLIAIIIPLTIKTNPAMLVTY